jgi:hypothetical protein
VSAIQDMFDGLVGIESDWEFVRDYIAKSFPDDPDDDRYITVMCECRMCGYTSLCSYPLNIVDETRLECHNCGHFTVEPVTYDLVVLT